MAITAETFELEHFEKLMRGLAVAHQAHAKLTKDLRDEEHRCAEALNDAEALRAELAERPTWDQWNAVVETIRDVDRGVRSLPELLALVKETA